MKTNIMLIGGEGYIGQIIQKIKIKDFEFFSYDTNTRDSRNLLDISNKKNVNKAINDLNPDVVINLAARTDLKGTRTDEYSINWIGVENIIDSIGSKDIWFVHFSSMLVCKLGHNLEHATDYCPDTVYGESKVKSEKTLIGSNNNKWTIIRPTTVWGENAKFPYSLFISIVKKYGFIELDIFSSKRDFCHEAYAKILIESMLFSAINSKRNLHKKIFYLTDAKPSSINDLAKVASKLYGGKTYKIPNFFNIFLNIMLVFFAKFGDILDKVFKIKFIMNTRRLKNMQTHSDLDKTMSKLIKTK